MSTATVVPVSVQGYLLNLTTRRAFHLFFGALLAGALSIFANLGVPWIPATVVVAYGMILLYSEVKLRVSLSESTSNSPYFLGFVFFLMALLRAFYAVSFLSNGAEQIIRQLGAALLTTIVGLPIRQALFAFAPSQADQDLFFRTLEEELRRSAAEFRRSQVDMVNLISEFVAMRRELFVEEQGAIKGYVKSLSKATAFLDGSLTSYPQVIASAMASCTQSLSALDGQVAKLAESSGKVDAAQFQGAFEMLANVSRGAGDLNLAVTSLSESLAIARMASDAFPAEIRVSLSQFTQNLNEVPSALREQIQKIKLDIDNVEHILDTFIVLLQERVEAIK